MRFLNSSNSLSVQRTMRGKDIKPSCLGSIKSWKSGSCKVRSFLSILRVCKPQHCPCRGKRRDAVAPVVQVEDDDNINPRDLRRRHLLAVGHDHTDQRKGVGIVQS
jgi:hypothetical protein